MDIANETVGILGLRQGDMNHIFVWALADSARGPEERTHDSDYNGNRT